MLNTRNVLQRNLFLIAKTPAKSPDCDLRRSYYLNLERGLIASLILVIAFLYIFPRMNSHDVNRLKDISLIEVIDIPVVKKPEIIPPPPIEKIVEPVVVVEKKEEKSLKDKIKEEKLTLNISEKIEDLYLASSQIGDIGGVDLSLSSLSSSGNSRLDMEYETHRSVLDDDASLSLDLSRSTGFNKKTDKSLKNSSKSLFSNDLNEGESNKAPEKEKAETVQTEQGVFASKDQFILKESESTIGTREFKIWNRINSSLDRLNKDRYGDLPKNVQRVQNGLTVSFAFSDGARHDIFWKKGGKVIIRVTGRRPKDQISELNKAYDGLLHLIYKIDLSSS